MSRKNRLFRILPCAIAALASASSAQVTPVSDTRELYAYASGTDDNGTFSGDANSGSYAGPVTGYWFSDIGSNAVDPGPGLGLARAEIYSSSNFLTGGDSDSDITDGNMYSFAIAGVSGSDAYGNARLDGRFQVSFTVAEPAQVELTCGLQSELLNNTPTGSMSSELEFTGPAVGVDYYAYASSASSLNEVAGTSDQPFMLYPNGVYTFAIHVSASLNASEAAMEEGDPEPALGNALTVPVSTWSLSVSGSQPTVGSFNPSVFGIANWSNSSNWVSSTVPNGSDQIAYLGQASTPQSVSLDEDVTLGILTIDSTNSYTINGPSTLTIYGPTNGAGLNVLNGNHTINAATTLESDTTVDVVHASDSLTMTALQPSSVNVTKVDPGAWIVNALSVTSLTVKSGLVQVAAQATADNSNSVNSLTIATCANGPTGTLDLTNNELTINYGSGTDPISTVQSLLTSGYNAGGWNGSGITSSTAAARYEASPTTALGYDDNGTGTISIMYTLAGDANLDGTVDFSDLAIVLHYYGATGTDWQEGNFTYNASAGTNFTDLSLVEANYGDNISDYPDAAVDESLPEMQAQFAPILAMAAKDGVLPNVQAFVDGLEDIPVPEPTSLVLLGIGTIGLLGRRRSPAAAVLRSIDLFSRSKYLCSLDQQ